MRPENLVTFFRPLHSPSYSLPSRPEKAQSEVVAEIRDTRVAELAVAGGVWERHFLPDQILAVLAETSC